VLIDEIKLLNKLCLTILVILDMDTEDAQGVPTLVCRFLDALVRSFITHIVTWLNIIDLFCLIVLVMEDILTLTEEEMNNVLFNLMTCVLQLNLWLVNLIWVFNHNFIYVMFDFKYRLAEIIQSKHLVLSH